MRARKRFGQHFLEPAWQVKVLSACAVAPGDTVLEIGPGRGALTIALAERAAHVLAVELDRDLAAALAARAAAAPAGGQRRLPAAGLGRPDGRLGAAHPGPVRVVGNLPYNVSSPILFRLLDVAATHPHADRRDADAAGRGRRPALGAVAGTRDYGVLTLLTALRADVEPLLALPPGAFRPVPTVRSALVRLRFRPLPAGVTRPTEVSRLVRSAFTQRRKTIGNALKALGTADGRRRGGRPARRRPRPACGGPRRCSSLNTRHLRTPGRSGLCYSLAQPALVLRKVPAVRNVGSSASAIGVADDRREPARLRQLARVPCAASRSGAWLGYLCPCRMIRRPRLRSMSCRWAGSASSA